MLVDIQEACGIFLKIFDFLALRPSKHINHQCVFNGNICKKNLHNTLIKLCGMFKKKSANMQLMKQRLLFFLDGKHHAACRPVQQWLHFSLVTIETNIQFLYKLNWINSKKGKIWLKVDSKVINFLWLKLDYNILRCCRLKLDKN